VQVAPRVWRNLPVPPKLGLDRLGTIRNVVDRKLVDVYPIRRQEVADAADTNIRKS